MSTTLPPPDRAAFRAAIAQVAATATGKLPASLGRITGAVQLALAGDVDLLPDGGAMVASRTKAGTEYFVVNGTCECPDYARAPGNLCAHRLAYGLMVRAQELLHTPAVALAAPVPVDPETVPEPFPDNDDPEPAPASPAVAPALPVPLPEAAFSLTLKGTLGGVEALLTARGQTAAEFTANLEAIRGLLDAPASSQAQSPLSPQQHNAAAMHRPVRDFCPVHNVAMRWNEGRAGRKGWYSHRHDGQWCKGR